MTQGDFLVEMARRLAAAGVPFMVVGSHGSSFHGHPRATHDVDLVIDPFPQQLDEFLSQLGEPYYVNLDAAREALRLRTMFNIILVTEGWKADLIVRKDRPFSIAEFQRRQTAQLHGQALAIASAEDVILSKLEWNRISPSERQVHDALSVIQSQGAELDAVYLRKWAVELGVTDVLEELLRQRP